MSKDLEKSQRLILDALEAHGPFYLAALAGGDVDKFYKLLHRAAYKLCDAKKVGLIAYSFGNQKLIVTHFGDEQTAPASVSRKDLEATSKKVAEWLTKQSKTP